MGSLSVEERRSKGGLASVVKGLGERFEECKGVLRGTLGAEFEVLNEFEEENLVSGYGGELGRGRESEGERGKKRKIVDAMLVTEGLGKKTKSDVLSRRVTAPDSKSEFMRKTSERARMTAILSKKMKSDELSSRGSGRDLKAELMGKTSQSGRRPASKGPLTSPLHKVSTSNPVPKQKRTIDSIFEADQKRRELEAAQEFERLKSEAALREKSSIDSGLAECAQCQAYFEKGENGDLACSFHIGAKRVYYWSEETVMDARWFCCGREEGSSGCKRGKHIDSKIPAAAERMRAAYEREWEKAERVRYRRCSGCKGDEKFTFGEERDEKGEASKFLCQRCLVKQIFCYDCHRYYKASTMNNGPSGERTVCGTCHKKKLKPRAGEYLWCERCNEDYRVEVLDPEDGFFDIDVPLCLDCQGEDYFSRFPSRLAVLLPE